MHAQNFITRKADVDYIAIIRGIWRRHKALVAGVFFGVAIPGLLLVYFTSSPLYTSKASVAIEPAALAEIPFLREPPRRDTIATHMVLLKSRSLSEAVLKALSKDSQDELIAEPQYSDYWIMARNAVAGLFGKPPIVLSQQERALEELQMARMDFAPSKEADNVFLITATATKPRVATDLVNTHIQVLLSRARSVDHEDARMARDFLETQYQQAKESLARSESVVARLQDQKGRVAGGQGEFEMARIAQLQGALAEAQASQQVLSSRAEGLRKALNQARVNPSSAAVDENQARLKAFEAAQEQLAKLEGKLAALRERYTEAHPSVAATREDVTNQQAKIAQLAKQLPVTPNKADPAAPPKRVDLQTQLATTQRELEATSTREQTLKLQLENARGTLRNVNQDDLAFGNLRRSVDTNRNLLAVLSERLMAARIREQGDTSVIRVIDPASLPTQTTARRTQKLIVMILGLAGMLALGCAVGIEVLLQPLETETDIQKATGLPVLGSVGVMERMASSRRKRDRRPILLPPYQPDKGAANRPIHFELYRAIRANIETERLKSPFRSILVTSPGPHDGKSTTVLNLAHAFQELGQRVLLVEADLRRPSLAIPLALGSAPGIVDFLQGSATLDQVSRVMPSGITVIPGQIARGDAASLLASPRVKELLQAAGSRFDLILVDSAPVLAVPDNLLLAHVVDRVILVAKAIQTTARDLRKTQATLDRASGRVLGVVLNQANPRDVPYYHRRYRKYYARAASQTSPEASRQHGSAGVNAKVIPGLAQGRDDVRL